MILSSLVEIIGTCSITIISGWRFQWDVVYVIAGVAQERIRFLILWLFPSVSANLFGNRAKVWIFEPLANPNKHFQMTFIHQVSVWV